MNSDEKIAKAVGWSAVQNWGPRVVSFFVLLTLARLLEPKAFGLMALAYLMCAAVAIIVDQGFGEAIVQRAELRREDLDTAFWTALLTAGVLMVVVAAGAGLAATLFGEPQLGPMIRWLSLSFPLAALSSTQRALLRRELAIKSLAARSLGAVTAGGVVGIGMACFGFGVWSLVGQGLAAELVGTVLLWKIGGWRPGFSFSRRSFEELFAFGAKVTGARILKIFNGRSDAFLVGYFLGATALGYYTLAYRLVYILFELLTEVASSVALPVFSRLQEEPELMRRAFYIAARYACLVSFPAFIGMAIVAPELVTALYGPRWQTSVAITQVLAFAGILQCMFYFNGPALLAAGKPSWHLGLTALHAAASVIAVVVVVRFGIVAVAAAYVAINYLLSPVVLWVLRNVIGIDPAKYLRQCAGPALASLAMAIAAAGTRYFLDDFLGAYALLAAVVVIGAATYIVAAFSISPALYQEASRLVRLILPLPVWTARSEQPPK